MLKIRPFEGYLVKPEHAREVVSPAYDALTPAQRYEYAKRHPRNYFNVIRAVEEFPAQERPTEDELLKENARKLNDLINGGAYFHTEKPCYFIYRLRLGDHVQTGLIADVPMEAYDSGLIKKHENTRQDKEDQLVRHQEVVGASSSPICLAYKEQPEITRLMDKVTNGEPSLDFALEDGVSQTIWTIDNEADQRRFTTLFTKVPVTYVTDGHHRCAAASRFAAKKRAENPNHTGKEPYNFLFVGLFPDTELRIVAYNRCVRELDGLTSEAFLGRLKENFDVDALAVQDADQAEPRRSREMAMFLENKWYQLRAKPHIIVADDPVRALDVMLLHDCILEPILGIADPRTDPRIEYVAGTFGLSGLQDRCASAGQGAAFAVYPTSIDQLIAVADADRVMPPKSTCFDPKVRSGLFVRSL